MATAVLCTLAVQTIRLARVTSASACGKEQGVLGELRLQKDEAVARWWCAHVVRSIQAPARCTG